jgi:Fe-S cluster assembly iron-binding protein IscA
MVTVSQRAKEELFEELLEQQQAANLEGAAISLRVAAFPNGQWVLVPDHPREDDQVVEFRGSTVLLVDPVAQSALDGVRVDCVETTEGDRELILVTPDDKDDEFDPDADEESEL